MYGTLNLSNALSKNAHLKTEKEFSYLFFTISYIQSCLFDQNRYAVTARKHSKPISQTKPIQ